MKYLFGPVPSRRLGRSLGIDLLKKKICNFNCIYCEVAKTEFKTTKRDRYVPTEDVIAEIKQYLYNNFNNKPDFITFSGSGEPTLHSDIGYIIDTIKSITDIPVAVLTNSGTITNSDVYKELLKADLVVPSLDAISWETLLKINKVNKDFDVEMIVEALSKFKKEFSGEVWLEILVLKDVNDTTYEFQLLKDAVDKIDPDLVQIHTISRPSMAGSVEKVSEERLIELSNIIGKKASIVRSFKDLNLKKTDNITSEQLLYSLLKIRACSYQEIVEATGIDEIGLTDIISKEIKGNKIKSYSFDGVKHYKLFEI